MGSNDVRCDGRHCIIRADRQVVVKENIRLVGHFIAKEKRGFGLDFEGYKTVFVRLGIGQPCILMAIYSGGLRLGEAKNKKCD